MKGEEESCDVTADRAGPRGTGACPRRVFKERCRAKAGRVRRAPGFAVVRGGGAKQNEGHLVDALALRGDEGRSTLRKARGRCERSLIPGSPNGATHPLAGIAI